jgi:hypothetical protein
VFEEVFDVKVLDRMSLQELCKMLGEVLDRMGKIEKGAPGGDDARYDTLMVIANQIIVRMDSIIRAHGGPEVLAQWEKSTDGYQERFKNYADTYLKGGVPLLAVGPDAPSQAPGADEAWRAKLDEIVLDEKLLDGMSAGDLFRVNSLITEKVEQLDRDLPEEVAGPAIEKLLKFGTLVIRRLDPLVREAYKDQPEKLARWEAIMNEYKDLDDEDVEDTRADVESPDVS